PAAHPDANPLERLDGTARGFEQPPRLGVDRYGEVGLPVAAEIEIAAIPDDGRVEHPALDELEAVDRVGELVGRADAVPGIAPDARAVLPRRPLALQHLGDECPVVGKAVDPPQAAGEELALQPQPVLAKEVGESAA